MKEERIEINIEEFIAEAFACNSKSYKEIDRLFNKYKEVCLEVINDNKEWKELRIVSEGSYEQEEYMVKVLSIICNSAMETKELINLVKKSYPYSYHYVTSITKLKVSSFLKKLSKKENLSVISTNIFNGYISSAIFVAKLLDKEIDLRDEGYNGYVKGIYYLKQRDSVDKRCEYVSLGKKEKSLIDTIARNVKTMYLNEPSVITLFSVDSSKLEDDLYKIDKFNGFERKVVPFEYVPELDGLNLNTIVGDDFISDEEFKTLVYCFISINRVDSPLDVNYEELAAFLVPAISLKYYAKEYKKAKERIFQIFSEENLDRIKELQREKDELKEEKLKLQEEVEDLRKENELLKKQKEKLSEELDKTKVLKMERNALIEKVFSDEEDIESENIDNTINEAMNSSDVVVFGGHQRWINKMKRKLPNWTFVPEEAINFDPDVVRNNKYVLINTVYNGHDMYYRVSSFLTEKNTLCFINRVNYKRMIEDFEEQLKR